MEDKIILKFKTKNILNFYEIEPWYPVSDLSLSYLPKLVYWNISNS